MGCAASPIKVIFPPRLSHGWVGQLDKRLCHAEAPSGMPRNASRKGEAKCRALVFISATIAGPARVLGSEARQDCVSSHVHSAGSSDVAS